MSQSQKSIVVENNDEILAALSKYSENEIWVDLRAFSIDIHLINGIEPNLLSRYKLLPLMVNQSYLLFAGSPPNDEVQSIIQIETGYKPIFINAETEQIKRVLSFYHGKSSAENTTFKNNELAPEQADSGQKTAVSKVDDLLKQAIDLNSSDIHIFPESKQYQILFRIDGVLHKMQSLSIDATTSIIARIKILSGLNITEKQLPQDGSISLTHNKGKIDFRVSLIPTVEGDSLAIRVLDSIENIKELNEIGFNQLAVAQIKNMLTDSGIILITGQTGSGKSTTIYALINELMQKNLNIITIEDPVEYKLSGVRQIQIQESIGYDFASALRSILRHDPDVIVVGEIRDQKTAQIAIQSALTGHLVISTLHTKSAIGSITRLLEIGIQDYLLASVLKGVVAQKLVRKTCQSCGGSDKGCIECNHTGYFGRTPIYEVLALSPKLANLIANQASEEELFEQAKNEGFVLIEQYAKKLVDSGITNELEINRRLNSYE